MSKIFVISSILFLTTLVYSDNTISLEEQKVVENTLLGIYNNNDDNNDDDDNTSVWNQNAMGANQLAQALEKFITTANFTSLTNTVVPPVLRNQVESFVNFLYGDSNATTTASKSVIVAGNNPNNDGEVIRSNVNEQISNNNLEETTVPLLIPKEMLINLLEDAIIIMENRRLLLLQEDGEMGSFQEGGSGNQETIALSQVQTILESIFTGNVNLTSLNHHISNSQLIPNQVKNSYQSWLAYLRGGNSSSSSSSSSSGNNLLDFFRPVVGTKPA